LDFEEPELVGRPGFEFEAFDFRTEAEFGVAFEMRDGGLNGLAFRLTLTEVGLVGGIFNWL
jgi:hypothetical protein